MRSTDAALSLAASAASIKQRNQIARLTQRPAPASSSELAPHRRVPLAPPSTLSSSPTRAGAAQGEYDLGDSFLDPDGQREVLSMADLAASSAAPAFGHYGGDGGASNGSQDPDPEYAAAARLLSGTPSQPSLLMCGVGVVVMVVLAVAVMPGGLSQSMAAVAQRVLAGWQS